MSQQRDDSVPEVAPERLLDASPTLSGPLREYARKTRFGSGEARAWAALQRRRSRSRRRQPMLIVSALAMMTLAALAFGSLPRHSLPIVAETLPSRGEPRGSSERPAPGERLAVPERPAPTADAAAKRAAGTAKQAPSAAKQAASAAEHSPARAPSRASAAAWLPVSAPVLAEAAPSPTPVAADSGLPHENGPETCTAEQRAGRYEAALHCFQGVAAGNGVSAELALYEQARLESAVMGHPEAALRTLDAHQQRFPAGSLAAEALLMKLGLLAQTNDPRALTELDRAMASSLGAERRADLLFLRGNILKSRNHCADALASYELARQAGINALRIERAARTCQSPR